MENDNGFRQLIPEGYDACWCISCGEKMKLRPDRFSVCGCGHCEVALPGMPCLYRYNGDIVEIRTLASDGTFPAESRKTLPADNVNVAGILTHIPVRCAWEECLRMAERHPHLENFFLDPSISAWVKVKMEILLRTSAILPKIRVISQDFAKELLFNAIRLTIYPEYLTWTEAKWQEKHGQWSMKKIEEFIRGYERVRREAEHLEKNGLRPDPKKNLYLLCSGFLAYGMEYFMAGYSAEDASALCRAGIPRMAYEGYIRMVTHDKKDFLDLLEALTECGDEDPVKETDAGTKLRIADRFLQDVADTKEEYGEDFIAAYGREKIMKDPFQAIRALDEFRAALDADTERHRMHWEAEWDAAAAAYDGTPEEVRDAEGRFCIRKMDRETFMDFCMDEFGGEGHITYPPLVVDEDGDESFIIPTETDLMLYGKVSDAAQRAVNRMLDMMDGV